MADEREHRVMIKSDDSEIVVTCWSCNTRLANLGQLATPLEINTVTLNHYRDVIPPPDVELEPVPMPERNPHLPEAPADGKHKFGVDGSSYRCSRCGVYNRAQSENPPFYEPCKGEWAESGKMRAWAADKWRDEQRGRATTMHVTTGVPSSGDNDEGLDLG